MCLTTSCLLIEPAWWQENVAHLKFRATDSCIFMCDYFQGYEGCPPTTRFLPLFLYSVARVLSLWHLPSSSPPPGFLFFIFLTQTPARLLWWHLCFGILKSRRERQYKKGRKNRETFVDKMLFLLWLQLTRAFIRSRLSEHTVALAFPLKKSIREEVGEEGQRLKVGNHVSACAQMAKAQPAAQRSVTNKSLRVQESGDSLLRSPSHEYGIFLCAAELKWHFQLFSPSVIRPQWSRLPLTLLGKTLIEKGDFNYFRFMARNRSKSQREDYIIL